MSDELEQWIKKVNEKKDFAFDLSRDEDMSIAIMNLISLEEHFFFTAVKTQNQKYLDMLLSVREMRKELLAKIVKDPVGEEWCISKHLLAGSMRLFEVGTKELARGNKEEANLYFQKSFNLYSMFFAINLKMVKHEDLEKNEAFRKEEKKTGRFSEIMKKIIDCCKEW